jgi:hypothetical protein
MEGRAASDVIPVRLGETEVLVETTRLAGTEPTSRPSRAADSITSAFDDAQQAILELATKTAATLEHARQRSARPDRLTVEFGLKVSASGNVVVAGASAEATLRVTLSYDGRGDESFP